MKNIFKTAVSLILVSTLVTSCSTSSDLASNSPIKKRRYTKGFHVDFKKNHKADKHESYAQNEILNLDRDLKKPESHHVDGLTAMENSKTAMLEYQEAKKSIFGVERTESTSVENTPIAAHHPVANWESNEMVWNNFTKPAPLPPAAASGEPQWLYYVLAIIIPPLGIGLLYGITTEFWISLILTLIFWLPGAIYSIIMTLKWYGEM